MTLIALAKNSVAIRAVLRWLEKPSMPSPGMRIMTGLLSRIAGESLCLHAL